jgi:predicted ArsR family transcriptional regulator
MSAIEQPAARSGRITVCSSEVRMSADSAMKCTPQKTIHGASGRAAACWASLKESPVTSANSMTSSRW